MIDTPSCITIVQFDPITSIEKPWLVQNNGVLMTPVEIDQFLSVLSELMTPYLGTVSDPLKWKLLDNIIKEMFLELKEFGRVMLDVYTGQQITGGNIETVRNGRRKNDVDMSNLYVNWHRVRDQHWKPFNNIMESN